MEKAYLIKWVRETESKSYLLLKLQDPLDGSFLVSMKEGLNGHTNGKVHTITEIQSSIEVWQNSVLPENKRHPFVRMAHLLDETDEAVKVVSYFGDPGNDEEALAYELADITITAIGLIGLLGFNANEIVTNKIKIMKEKYDPEEIKLIQEVCGLTWDEAMEKRKAEWSFENGNGLHTNNK